MSQTNTFKVVEPNQIPARISVIIWDVNGTITFKDQLDEEVIKEILQSAAQGVQHIFITGRDRAWLVDFFVIGLREIAGKANIDYQKAISNMWLYPELGLIFLEPPSLTPIIYEGVKDHPWVISPLRKRIATLFWQVDKLQEWKEGDKIPSRFYIIRDANRKAYLHPLVFEDVSVDIKLPDFIWSDTKEIIGTAEIIRENDNQISPRRRAKIDSAVQILEALLEYLEIKTISISPVSTAINIAPIVDGVALDKDWATGRALTHLAKQKGWDLNRVIQQTIGIGDGMADFLFSYPIINGKAETNIPFVFVGPAELEVPQKQKANTIIWSEKEFSGPAVTKDVLIFLKEKMQPFS